MTKGAREEREEERHKQTGRGCRAGRDGEKGGGERARDVDVRCFSEK
jgi:hypothetical protein